MCTVSWIFFGEFYHVYQQARISVVWNQSYIGLKYYNTNVAMYVITTKWLKLVPWLKLHPSLPMCSYWKPAFRQFNICYYKIQHHFCFVMDFVDMLQDQARIISTQCTKTKMYQAYIRNFENHSQKVTKDGQKRL